MILEFLVKYPFKFNAILSDRSNWQGSKGTESRGKKRKKQPLIRGGRAPQKLIFGVDKENQ